MNPTYLQWIATLLGLVENYAAARQAGATAGQANMGLLAEGMAIAQHLATPHTGLTTAPATPTPIAQVNQTPQ